MSQDSYSKDYTRPDPTIPGVYVLTLVILVFIVMVDSNVWYLCFILDPTGPFLGPTIPWRGLAYNKMSFGTLLI